MSYFESAAEKAFRESGPFFHLYSKALENDTFFQSPKERVVITNLLSIAITESPCVLLAFAIMANHFHFILEGSQAHVIAFFERLKKMMNTYYRYHGRSIDLSDMTPGLKEITSVRQFRTELAYVIRNAFVVRPDVNVFADLWSSGNLYFNPCLSLDGVPGDRLKTREVREFTQSRSYSNIDARIHVKNGMAQAWSFVNYKKAMSFYDSARQFVYSVLKNVEAMVEVSLEYGELPQLPDEELYPVMYKLCQSALKAEDPFSLDKAGKQKLATLLKNKYYASNGQIARILKMPLVEVNVLFPLVAKAQIK